MMFGYVFISTKNLYEREVADKLSRLDEVVDVEPLLVAETAMADPFFEDFDLIAKIRAYSLKSFKEVVDDKIHTIHGVDKTRIVLKPKLL